MMQSTCAIFAALVESSDSGDKINEALRAGFAAGFKPVLSIDGS